MAEQIPGSIEGGEETVGSTTDYASLLKDVDRQRARLAGIYEVYACGLVIWHREKRVLEEMEERLDLLKQGQLSL